MTNIRPLSPALAEQARKELNENPKTLASDLEALKQWLAKQPHIIAKTGKLPTQYNPTVTLNLC